MDERGFAPLHDAADKGNTRVINRLLQGDEEEEEEEVSEEEACMHAHTIALQLLPVGINVRFWEHPSNTVDFVGTYRLVGPRERLVYVLTSGR